MTPPTITFRNKDVDDIKDGSVERTAGFSPTPTQTKMAAEAPALAVEEFLPPVKRAAAALQPQEGPGLLL